MSDSSPKVTGLSPAEGSPGTKVTVRGENLGAGQDDLVSVTICGVDCTMFAEWKSSHKIVTRTRFCSGQGDVIVTTKSAGKGSCTVQFKGVHETVSPSVESAVWVDEAHLFHSAFPALKGPSSSSQINKDSNLMSLELSSAQLNLNEAQLKQTFPDRGADVYATNFSAEMYLLKNHMGTGFEGLKNGLKELDRRVGSQQEGPSTFLKSNVNGIVVCLDVLQELNRLTNKDKKDMGSALTKPVAAHLSDTLKEAEIIFENILKRKESSDSMRTSLGILHKYRFLFNLPAQIDNNVKMGEYDVVISDYSRVRQVFQDTEVAIFRRVLQDVEQRVAAFKAKLQQGIKQFPAPLEERKKLISYLVQLDGDRNPGWEAIEFNNSWLLEQMDELKQSHLVKSGTDLHLHSDNPPHQVQFVQSICRLFCTHCPDFFALLQSYLSREIEGVHKVTNDDEVNRSGDMTLKLVCKLCLEVRAALLPSHTLKPSISWPPTASSTIGPWLPTCLRSVRNCYSCLLKLDSIQGSSLNQMQSLIFNLREHALVSLFNQAAQDVGKLHEHETWQMTADDDNSCGSCTQLPLLFENRVLEALELVRENVLQSSSSQMFGQINVQAAIKQNVQSIISSFVESLEKGSESESRRPLSPTPSRSNVAKEDKLLMSLSNIAYTRTIVLPHIHNAFMVHQYPDISDIIKNGEGQLERLDSKLILKVIDLMEKPLVGRLEGMMEEYSFDWKTNKTPTDVSTYIKEILMDLTELQCRVMSVSDRLVERVLPNIVAAVVQELARLYSNVKGHSSKGGNPQICLDIQALEESLQNLNGNNVFELLRPSRERLGSGERVHHELMDSLMKQFRFQQRLQIMCFQ